MNPWFLTLCDHRTPGLGYFIVRSYFIIARVTIYVFMYKRTIQYLRIFVHIQIKHSHRIYIYIYSFVPPRGTTRLPPQSASALRLSGSPASLFKLGVGGGGLITFMTCCRTTLRLTNLYVGCRTVTFRARFILYGFRQNIKHFSISTCRSLLFRSFVSYGSMDHGLHCSAWNPAELLALGILAVSILL